MPVIVLDFDGVIVRGSEAAKRACWSGVLDGDALVRCLRAYDERRGTRYDIIRQVLGPGDDAALMGRRYSRLLQDAIVAEGVHPDDRAALIQLKEQHWLCVNSATPQSDLDAIIDALDLRSIFRSIHGFPSEKAANLRTIASECGVNPKELLFVGDAMSDYVAAREIDCRFIGVGDTAVWPQGIPRISAIAELPPVLRRN